MQVLGVSLAKESMVSFIDPEDIQERVAWFFHGTCEESLYDLHKRVLARREHIEKVTGKGTVSIDRFWSPSSNFRSYFVLSMDAEVYERFSGNPRHIVADVF